MLTIPARQEAVLPGSPGDFGPSSLEVLMSRCIGICGVVAVILAVAPASLPQVKIAELSGAPGSFTAATSLVFQEPGNIGYATNPGSGLVQKFRPTTGETLATLQLASGIGPATLSFDQKTLAVLGIASQTLYLIDSSSMTLRKEVTYAGSGFTARNSVLLTQDGSKIFVSDAGRNHVAVFNGSDGSFHRFLDVGIHPGALHLLPNGKHIAVLCSGKTPGDLESLYFIDTITVSIIDSRTLPGTDSESFNNIEFTISGSHLFVPVYNGDRLLTYDLNSGNLASRSSYGRGPTKAQSSPDGRLMALINARSSSVALLTLPEALLSRDIVLPDLEFTEDSTVTFSPDSRTLYIPAPASGEIIAYELNEMKVKSRIKVGAGPLKLAATGDSRLLASVETGGNLVSMIALAPNRLYLAHLIQDATEFSGIAIANFGLEGANVAFSARDDNGKLLAGTTNPRIVTVPAGQQRSFIASRIFGFNPIALLDGWIEANTLGSSLSILYLNGTIAQTQLDGFLVDGTVGKLLGFSRITEQVQKYGRPTSTEIVLVNPAETKADLTLRLYGSTLEGPGALLSHVTATLPAQSRLRGRLSRLIPNVVYPIEKGYLEVTSTVDIHGLEIVKIGDSSAMIPAKVRGLSGTEFVATQFASGGAGLLDTPIFTSISFCNVSTGPVTLTAEVTGEDGRPIPAGASPSVRTLQPGENLVAVTGDPFFAFADPRTDPKLNVGTLKITADKPGLIGDVLTGDALNGSYLTGVALRPKSAAKLSFTHFAEGRFGNPPKGLYTGIALYNPDRDDAEVTIEAFSPDGVLLGKTRFDLGAKKRLSRTISELIPEIRQQEAGTVRITSTVPLFAFEVFGSNDSQFLSAVPPIY